MPVIHSLYSESGTVRINLDTCTKCSACVKICPGDILTLKDQKVTVLDDSHLGCIACGHCMMVCPTGAVSVSGRGVSFEDVQPLPQPDQRASVDALEALMQSRRSVRRFKKDAVPADILQRVVDMATTAPMGIPPWDIGCVTVSGHDKIQGMVKELIKGYEGFLKIFQPWLLKLIRPMLGKAKYDMFAQFIRPLAKSYVEGYREGRDLIFYEAPALLLFYHSPYAEPTDAVIACTYAMLAAESLGLGSTIIGGAPPILQRNKALCQKLGIPDNGKPCTCLILGYPATQFRHGIKRRFLP